MEPSARPSIGRNNGSRRTAAGSFRNADLGGRRCVPGRNQGTVVSNGQTAEDQADVGPRGELYTAGCDGAPCSPMCPWHWFHGSLMACAVLPTHRRSMAGTPLPQSVPDGGSGGAAG